MAETLLDKSEWVNPDTLDYWLWLLDPNDTTDGPTGSDKRVKGDKLRVAWNNVKNKPTVYPSNWNNVANKPNSFNTQWSQISSIPNTLLYSNQAATITARFDFDRVPDMKSESATIGGATTLDLHISVLHQLTVESDTTLDYANENVRESLYVFVFRMTAGSLTLTLAAGKWRYVGSAPAFSTTNGHIDRMICYFNKQDGVMEILQFDNNVQTS